MQWMEPYPFLLFIGAAIYLYFTFFSLKFNHLSGRRFFPLITFSASVMILLTGFELMIESFSIKIWLRNFQQIPLFFCAIFLLAFVRDYTQKPISTAKLTLISIPNIVYILLIFTDQFHHFMRLEVGLHSVGGISGVTVEPTLLNMIFITYNQLICIYTFIFLAMHIKNVPKHHLRQYVLTLIGIGIPILLFFIMPLLNVNILGYMALTLMFTGAFLFYAFFRQQFLSVWPVAKDKIYENMNDGVMLTDRDGVILDLNPVMEKLLSKIHVKNKLPVIGENIDFYLQLCPSLAMLHSRNSKVTKEVTINLVQHIHYKVSIIPLEKDNNISTLIVLSDISKEKQNFLKLQEINEQQKQLQKQRTEMLANIAHDLGSPVIGIQTYINLLLEDKIQVDKDILKQVYYKSNYIKDLVDDLFELSQLEGKEFPFHLQPMKVKSFINDIQEEFNNQLLQAGMHFYTGSIHTTKAGFEAVINIDINKIKRVLQNFIDNAVKFRGNKSVSITFNCFTICENDKQEYVRFEIVDEGNGIPPDQQEQIFQRFYSKRDENISGSGLGLTISKEIIEQHKGTIGVESEVGVGSTFYFKLPITEWLTVPPDYSNRKEVSD